MMPRKVLGKKFIVSKLHAIGIGHATASPNETAATTKHAKQNKDDTNLTLPEAERDRLRSVSGTSSSKSTNSSAATNKTATSVKKSKKTATPAATTIAKRESVESEFAKTWHEEQNALSPNSAGGSHHYQQHRNVLPSDDDEVNVDKISIPERPCSPSKLSVKSLPTAKSGALSARISLNSGAGASFDIKSDSSDMNRSYMSPKLVRSQSFRVVGAADQFDDFYYSAPGAYADLRSSVRLALKAVDLFLDNQMVEAQQLLKPHIESSLYAAVTYSAIRFFQAVMTMDREDVSGAQNAIQATMEFCDTRRQPRSRMDKMTFSAFRKSGKQHISQEQMHAELCYAECGLMKAFLVFMSDENLVSFIKGGWKIHQCYSSYKECLQWLMQMRGSSSSSSKTEGEVELDAHFESGVRLGYGAFNLIFSSLPPRVLSLLKMVGFSGDRDLGIRELELGLETGGMRSMLSRFTLISWNSITCYIIGNGEGDLSAAARLLQPISDAHADGAIILFLHGRLEELQGNVDIALKYFMRSACVQNQWKQFHHLNWWEMTWCYVYTQQWMLGAAKTALLLRENDWSKAMYAYMCAAFLLMQQQTSIVCGDETFTVDGLMDMIPALKQRFAGHSIPIEKFVVRKSRRYVLQNKWLLLPVFEAAYLWTGWVVIGRSSTLLLKALKLIELEERRAVKRAERDADVKRFHSDNKALATFLRGCCYSYLEEFEQAEKCFCAIFEHADSISEDKYIVPYAFMEMAALKLCTGDVRSARNYLQEGKKFSNFSMESRYNFRARALDEQISQVESRRLSASNVRLQWFTPPATPRSSLTDIKSRGIKLPSKTSPLSVATTSSTRHKHKK